MQVGAGKTSVASEIIRLATQRGKRCMFLVHRVELVHQAAARLQQFGIEPGIIKAGFRAQPRKPVQVACVPTLARRALPPMDVVIFDECHHAVSRSWLDIAAHYRASGAYTLGITATPLRLDGKPLGDVFEEIVEPVTTAELVQGGYLIAPTVFAPPVDLSGLPKRMGDYAIPQLAERMSPLCGNIVETWRKRADGVRTVAFAVNIQHSLQIEDAFRRVGVRVTHLDGRTPPKQRARVNAMLRCGDLDMVTQVGLFSEGYDLPDLGCIIVARPTKSLSMHRQMIGRVMRTAPGKTRALVLDHAGNYHEHGSILDEIEWSLEAPAKRESTAERVRTCKECFAVLLPGVDACQECGTAVGSEAREQTTPGVAGDGELIEIGMAPRRVAPEQRAAEYCLMVSDASRRGYKVSWARHRYKSEFGTWPKQRGTEIDHYVCPGHEWERARMGSMQGYYERCKWCMAQPEDRYKPRTAAGVSA